MSLIIYSIVLAIIFLGTIIPFFVMNSSTGQLRSMKAALFLLLFTVLISVVGFFGVMSGVADSMVYFFVFQFISLGLGYLLCFLLQKNFFGELRNEGWSKA